jgi:SAM-dependent methyltransferase
MKAVRFTGERLHTDDPRFGLDIARHIAAYEYARGCIGGGHVLDLGSGSGYGTARLADTTSLRVGVDRVAPERASRRPGTCFVCADLSALPFAAGRFDAVLSFQVIEHLENPADHLDAVARLMRPNGIALLTTPNALMSDGANPYHVHEYDAEELANRLRARFADVTLHGIGMSDAVRATLGARSRRIRAILRLDPLRLRERLPAALTRALFAFFAVLVRFRGPRTQSSDAVSWRDFPIGAPSDDCLDLLAVCRRPR